MFTSQYRLTKAHQERLLADANQSYFGVGGKATQREYNSIDIFLLRVSHLMIEAGEEIQCTVKQKACESVQTSVQ